MPAGVDPCLGCWDSHPLGVRFACLGHTCVNVWAWASLDLLPPTLPPADYFCTLAGYPSALNFSDPVLLSPAGTIQVGRSVPRHWVRGKAGMACCMSRAASKEPAVLCAPPPAGGHHPALGDERLFQLLPALVSSRSRTYQTLAVVALPPGAGQPLLLSQLACASSSPCPARLIPSELRLRAPSCSQTFAWIQCSPA